MAKEKYLYFEDTASTTESSLFPASGLLSIDVADTAVALTFKGASSTSTTEDVDSVAIATLTTNAADEEVVLEQVCKLIANSRAGVIDVVAVLGKVTACEMTYAA
tara:strand:+ start:449 stop:763 length:315 start_codon:yes stop_codon:yes gene_type:complete